MSREVQEFIDALQVFVLEIEARQRANAGDQRDLAAMTRRLLESARTISDTLRKDRTLFDIFKS